MKKLTVLLLSALLVLGLTACGGTNSDVNSSSDETSATPASTAKTDTTAPSASTSAAVTSESSDTAPDTEEPSGNKTLVVYYSASGNTERIAQSIADAADADTFEIVPQKVYTSDDLNWTDKNSRVSREHDDELLRHRQK